MTKFTKVPAASVGNENYESIMRGLAQAKAHVEGVAPADAEYRVHKVSVPDTVDVREIRARTGLSQMAFAERFGFKLGTLRDWEQDRKQPERSNRLLLTIIQRRPEVLDEVLSA